MTDRLMTQPLGFSEEQLAALRARLPRLGEKVVAAIMAEVPAYSAAFQGRMGKTIQTAVTVALAGFFDMTTSPGADATNAAAQVRAAAYELGRGEARSGRSLDALTAAYRIGTATAWRDMSRVAVEHGLSAEGLAGFAEVVFDFLDQLSAESLAGHAEELARSGRLRERQLAQLATALIGGREEERLAQLAEQADWAAPQRLTAVILPLAAARSVRPILDPRTLGLAGDVEALEPYGGLPDHAVLLVPGARAVLLRTLGSTTAVVGPTLPWKQAQASFQRAARALTLGLDDGLVDTDLHLASLVVLADAAAHDDLRARVLAPLAPLRDGQREKLTDTLRAWLLHQGRRDDIAEALFVHPQTIRYRMGQLREAYGERLEDPSFVRDATIALG
ncbi:helix-turn-helix domain-containing protein [Nocardioides jiangxiensis]|uniref:Helix-turn-helix domain-containing protein n=1 Tax=Nocardioides jiangxiensis TaxID=3064524 RepID=A0ABT9B1G0_9ACTN|nr:helix-turn-helix domain-containing protein [Nocardioides sp. WY-20]MDO7868078.1 helix-turn-helix domain-containing protein [Nocardioides sp. WY-20]